jgi:putative alpha-1,2-mannosidase
MMAKELGRSDDYKTYLQRAQYYKNVFDPETNFMRGRFNNKWYGPFDPYEVNFNYTEANSWQYSYYVPQDISGHQSLVGGKDSMKICWMIYFLQIQKPQGEVKPISQV